MWVRLKEWAKRDKSFTDWCIAGFTFVLAGASIYQFIIMGRQLDTMRKDQRPWIRVSFDPAPMQVLGPIGGTVHLINNGKTPAKGVWAEMTIERIKNGEQPKLDYPKPYTRLYEGILFPNDPQTVWINRVRSVSGISVEPDPLTESEADDFKKVAVFFVVYGTVHYTDFFRSDHWTKFCEAILPPNTPGTATFKPCADYGDVDSN